MSDATDGASSVRETETRSVCCAVVSWDTIYPLTFYARARVLLPGVPIIQPKRATASRRHGVWSNRYRESRGCRRYSGPTMDDHRRGRS